MPHEVFSNDYYLVLVLQYLSSSELFQLLLINKFFNSTINHKLYDEFLWKPHCIKTYTDLYVNNTTRIPNPIGLLSRIKLLSLTELKNHLRSTNINCTHCIEKHEYQKLLCGYVLARDCKYVSFKPGYKVNLPPILSQINEFRATHIYCNRELYRKSLRKYELCEIMWEFRFKHSEDSSEVQWLSKFEHDYTMRSELHNFQVMTWTFIEDYDGVIAVRVEQYPLLRASRIYSDEYPHMNGLWQMQNQYVIFTQKEKIEIALPPTHGIF